MTARRRWSWAAGIAGVLLLAAAGAGVLVLRSDWFREQVRLKVIEVAERATGGRAVLQSFHYDWSAMRARVTGFTLHGREEEGRAPFVHVPSLELAIHVRSLLRRDVDLRSLMIERPEVHVYVAEDGSTNVPSPPEPPAGGTNLVEDLLRLRIGELIVRDGVAHFDSRRIPLEVRAGQVDASLTLAAADLLRYTLNVGRIRLMERDGFRLETAGTLSPHRVVAERFRVSRLGSFVEGTMELADFRAPSATGRVTADVQLHEWPELVLDGGRARAEAAVAWTGETGWRAEGRIAGDRLRLELDEFRMAGARLVAAFVLRSDDLEVTGTELTAFGGAWRGDVRLRAWRDLEVRGDARDLPLARLLEAARVEAFPWDALLSGPARLRARVTPRGIVDTVAGAELRVTPVEGQVALEGMVAAEWRQQDGTIRLDTSHLSTPSSRLTFEGTLGETLTAGLFSTNPQDLEPVLDLLTGAEVRLPFRLQGGGTVQVRAEVSGPLDAPRLSGELRAERVRWGEIPLTNMAARFQFSAEGLALDHIQLAQDAGRIEGRLRLGLQEWRVAGDAPIEAALQMRNLRLADAGKIAGARFVLEGVVDATLEAAGALDAPRGTLRWQGRQVNVAGEKFAQLNGSLKAESAEAVRVEGEVELDAAAVSFNGAYRHPPADWTNGEAVVRLATRGLRMSQSETVQQYREGLDARVSVEADAVVSVEKGALRLRRLDGALALDGVRDARRELGALRVEARTEGRELRLALNGRVDKTPFSGQSLVRLDPRYPASGTLRLADLPLSTLMDWLGGEEEVTALRGTLTAEARWSGELANPDKITTTLTIPQIVIAPAAGEDDTLADFALRNAGPVRLDVDANGLRVRNLRLVAKDTSLTVAGVYDWTSRAPWDISLNGAVNLGVLTNFEPDLIGSGVAQINANLRGAAANPSVSGRMEIRNGSLFLRGLTNGIENANGIVFFDRDRASIEKLTATTGGGTLSLGGFVGFGGGDWSYRLQARTQGVRVRYPEGVSTTVDSDLSLTGSQNASLLSGLVTVQRSGFSSRGDFASLIAGSGNPIPVPATQNEFLRNLQFDIRVRTSPNATFQTDYTQDLQTEADLRVRGSLAKPVVLGSVNVNQGEINFFGNRYTISRGEILFYNTATIQPSINLDLETRIRGVVVYIGVSGPLARLNVNYRSEPPLQSREILALLTVGRAPAATATGIQQQMLSPGAQQTGAGTNMLAEASNTLLGGALSASVSSRVEKFFGVSRIKIDPNVTGVENIPQARLTIEQSLSRDITLTFSSNLSRSSQQIIRLEWDLSRQWSAIAVRDENGAFGVDFLYRKRFK